MGRPPIYTDEKLDQLALSLKEWTLHCAANNEFGLLGDWCFKEAFNPMYFTRYAEKHAGFKEAYEWAKSWQEHIVSRGALKQTLNARFAQFFLSCNHDWRTKDASEDKLALLANDFGKYLEHMDNLKREGEDESQ